MRVLWMINNLFGRACELFNEKGAQSGSWIDATLNQMKTENNIIIGIMTTGINHELQIKELDGTVYYRIPGGKASRGKRAKIHNQNLWKDVINKFNPDLIQIWGSEFTDALDIISVTDIPCILYTQGVMSAISKYPFGGLKIWDLLRNIPFPYNMLISKYILDYKKIKKQVNFEIEIANKSKAIVTDNEWCNLFFKNMAPNVPVFYHSLPMNNVFRASNWTYEKCKPYSIFCNAGRTPYKGLHMAIRALAIVKQFYPQVMMIIPGDISFNNHYTIKIPPYFFYLKKLALQLNVIDNIYFPGVLTSEEMAKEMESANVFVMPSCIENLSTTLREAMLTGTPCISADVGCIKEYLHHGENGYLYRYEEFEILAQYIMKLFSNIDLAVSFSKKARLCIEDKYVSDESGHILYEIYDSILND